MRSSACWAAARADGLQLGRPLAHPGLLGGGLLLGGHGPAAGRVGGHLGVDQVLELGVGRLGHVVEQLGTVQQVADALGVDHQGEHGRDPAVDVGGIGPPVDHRLLGLDLELGPGRLQHRLPAPGLGGPVAALGLGQGGLGGGDVAVGLFEGGGQVGRVGLGVLEDLSEPVQLALDLGELGPVLLGGAGRRHQQRRHQGGDQDKDGGSPRGGAEASSRQQGGLRGETEGTSNGGGRYRTIGPRCGTLTKLF